MLHSFAASLRNRELMLVVVGQAVSIVTGFVFIKLVSHYASVSQYGLYALALTLAGLVGLFPFAIFDQAVARYISTYRAKDQYSENYTNILLVYVALLAVYGLFFAAIGYFLPTVIPGDIRSIFVALVLYTLFNTLRNTQLNIESANRNRHVVTNSKLFEGVARIALLLSLVYFSQATGAAELLYLSAAVFALNTGYLLYRNRADLAIAGASPSTTRENLRAYFVFSLPLFIWAGFGWVQSYVPIWFLKWNDTSGETYLVGQFAMLNTIGALIPTQLVGVTSTYVAPIIYQRESSEPGFAKAMVDKAARYLALVFAAVLSILLLFHDVIMQVLTSKQYVPGSWLLPYAFLAACFLGIGQIWALELFAYHQTRKLLAANIAPSVATLLLGYLLIPHWGIAGAVGCMVVAGLSYMGLVFVAKTRLAEVAA